MGYKKLVIIIYNTIWYICTREKKRDYKLELSMALQSKIIIL